MTIHAANTLPSTPPVEDDLRDVLAKLRELGEAGRLDELIELVAILLGKVRLDNHRLAKQLQAALRQLYGRRSEKVDVNQLALMFEKLAEEELPASARDCLETPEAPSLPGEDDEAADTTKRRKRKGRRGGRKPFPDDLERRTEIIGLPEPEKYCDTCGTERKVFGYETSELLEYVPAHFFVLEQKRAKGTCPKGCDGVATAPPDKVIERGRPGPALLAHVVVSKYQDALPLYRQSQIFRRSGVYLPASTLGDWVAFMADCLEPLYRQTMSWIHQCLCIQADDTGLRVLDKQDPRGVKRGHLWCYVGDLRWVVFRYAPDWKAEHPGAFLRGFEGFVQGDGYAGFKKEVGPPGQEQPVVPADRRLGCGMHLRRKFEQAAKGGDARGAVALAYFRTLYDVERSCKQDELGPDERLARRDELSQPKLVELYGWVEQLHPGLVPGTPL
jgi:transposase